MCLVINGYIVKGTSYKLAPAGVGSRASSFSAITPAFVKGLATSTGVQPYINHGLIPININSGKADLLKAYPHAASALMGLPSSFKLRDQTDIIYMK